MSETMAKQRGRRAETPEQRLARAMRDVEAAKQAVKETEKRRFAILGEAMWQEALADAAFMARCQAIARRRVTTKTGQMELAALFAVGGGTTSVVPDAGADNDDARAA